MISAILHCNDLVIAITVDDIQLILQQENQIRRQSLMDDLYVSKQSVQQASSSVEDSSIL